MHFPKFTMLVGLPGSGKTTFAKDYFSADNIAIISSDALREELLDDVNDQTQNNRIFYEAQIRVCNALESGKDVVYDATNLTRSYRKDLLSKLPAYTIKECYVVFAPIETCIERDACRSCSVGKEVIDRMVKSFQPPFFDEGWHSIKVKDNSPRGYCFQFSDYLNIPHDNSHHKSDTIYDHCRRALEYADASDYNYTLKLACLYHDLGKVYTKSFKESDTDAHYYNHQNVGAYLSYRLTNSSLDQKESATVAWLIACHMDPFFNTRYYRHLPEFLKRQIDFLHEADINADKI